MIRSRRSFASLFGLAVTLATVVAHADPSFLRFERVAKSPLDRANPASIGAASIAPAPGGGVLFTEWKSGAAFRLEDPDRGTPKRLEEVAPPVFYLAGGDELAFFSGPNSGSLVTDRSGSVRHRFHEKALQPIGGAVVAGERLFGAGVVRAGALENPAGEFQSGCPVFTVDFSVDSPRAEPLGCGESKIDAANLAVGGHFRLDGQEVYGIWDSKPDLFVFSRSGRLLRTIRIVDSLPALTMEDRKRILREPGGYYHHRARYRWAQGTLRTAEGGTAVIFREPASRGNGFTMDVYSREGRKIAASVPLDLGLKSELAVARPVSLQDGRQYVLVHEPDASFRAAGAQRFYRVLPSAPPRKKP